MDASRQNAATVIARPPRRRAREGIAAVITATAWLLGSCSGGGSSPSATAPPTALPTAASTPTAPAATATPFATATAPAAATPSATREPIGLTCAERPDPHCGQPINDILIPMLRSIGQEPRDAAPQELCRRLAVDLLGHIPTVDELDECARRPVEDTVDAWLQRPEYETVQRRLWSSEIGYDVAKTIWWQVFDLDELVAEMVRGEISYAEFAIQAIFHPAFFITRADEGWGAGVFNVFLGRPARRDEMDGTHPLAQLFWAREICDGRVAEVVYQRCLDEPPDGVECRRGCRFETYEGSVDPCGCTPHQFPDPPFFVPGFGCTGSGLGELVDLGTTSCERRQQLQSIIHVSAGETDRCSEAEVECPDLQTAYDRNNPIRTGPPAEPLVHISPALVTRLRLLGEALTRRGDFWEAAVDRELRRLLGWWQSGFRQPDFDIPEVRFYLANQLRESGDLRSVQRLILTSLLYTAPRRAPEGLEGSPEPPPWCSGPLKALVAESWLESAEVVVGEKLGICDHRFIAANSRRARFMAEATGQGSVRESTLSFAGLFPGPGGDAMARRFAEAVTFINLSTDLGGCGFDPRPGSANLSIVSLQGEISSLLCALGRNVVPDGVRAADTSDSALEATARHLLRRALSRDSETTEVAAAVSDMRACLDARECADTHATARWLCARLIDSTAFALY